MGSGKVWPDMDESLLRQFQQKYESLAGVVHLVSGVEEAAEVVASVLREAGARRVAWASFRSPCARPSRSVARRWGWR